MASVNKVIIAGNLGRDPEIRFDQSGNMVATLSIATSDYWKDKVSGETKERTEWHRVVIFHQHYCRVCEKIKEGDQMYVEGQLQTRKWVDQQGQEHKVKEIVIRFKGEVLLLRRGKNNTLDRSNDKNDMPFEGISGSPKADSSYEKKATNSSHSESSSTESQAGAVSPPKGFDDEIPF